LPAAVAAGADALGFVFYAPARVMSRRSEPQNWLRIVPAFVTKVGLFVNETEHAVRQVMADGSARPAAVSRRRR
jgi:phosphoribosylanthranilate isomerase